MNWSLPLPEFVTITARCNVMTGQWAEMEPFQIHRDDIDWLTGQWAVEDALDYEIARSRA